MVVLLVLEPVKNIVDLAADVGSQAEELPVDSVQDGLEEVSFSRVLTVKQLKQLGEKITH